jgi:hypothetical protein
MPGLSQGKDCISAFPAGCSRNTLDHASRAAKKGEQAAPAVISPFQIMTTSATSSTLSVMAHGVFTAAGVDHSGSKG